MMQENTPPHLAFDEAWFARFQRPMRFLLNCPLTRRITRRFFAITPADCPLTVAIDEITPGSFTYGARRISDELEERTTDFRTHNKFSKRVYFILKPFWWAMHFWDELFADTYAPRLSFGFSTLTKYPGAGTGGTTVDGTVRRQPASNESWSTMRAGAGTHYSATQTAGEYGGQLGDSSSSMSRMWRAIFTFDTSSLGASANISSAVFSLYGLDKSNGLGADTLHICSSTPASNNDLTESDYSQLGSTSFANITYASFSTSGYNDFTLDANGIANVSKTSISKFGSRGGWDINNSYGGGSGSSVASYFYGYQADQSGTSSDPKLVITYTTPTAWTQTCSETLTLTASNVSQAGKVASETVTLTASIINSTGRALSEVVTLTVSLLNQGGKVLSEAITLTDSIINQTGKVLAEALTLTASTIATTARELADTVTLTASALFQTTRELLDSVSITDSLTAFKVAVKELADSISLTDTLDRAMAKVAEEVVTLTDTITNAISRAFEEVVTLTATAYNLTAKTLSEAVTLTEEFMRTITKLATETVTLTASIASAIGRSFSETITLTATATKQIAKTFSETITTTASQIITSGKVIAETLTITATLTTLRVAYKSLTETISLSDTLGRVISIVRTETLSLADKWKKYLNGINMDWRTKFTGQSTSWSDKYTEESTDWTDTFTS